MDVRVGSLRKVSAKNWCFWTVVLEKTLESPLGCKEIQQSTLKECSPENSLKRLMLKLKLQYFGHLVQRTDSLGKIEGGRRRGWRWDGWMASLTWWTWVWVSSGNWWWTGKPGVLQSMGSQRVRHNWVTEPNWLIHKIYFKLIILNFRIWGEFWYPNYWSTQGTMAEYEP